MFESMSFGHPKLSRDCFGSSLAQGFDAFARRHHQHDRTCPRPGFQNLFSAINQMQCSASDKTNKFHHLVRCARCTTGAERQAWRQLQELTLRGHGGEAHDLRPPTASAGHFRFLRLPRAFADRAALAGRARGSRGKPPGHVAHRG